MNKYTDGLKANEITSESLLSPFLQDTEILEEMLREGKRKSKDRGILKGSGKVYMLFIVLPPSEKAVHEFNVM